jgi:hypothetical protein
LASDAATDKITEILQVGIRETIENRDEHAFERAAKEAYKVRTGGLALSDDDAIINHVFPSDVRQTVALGLHLVDSDKEKASVILKGALESVLRRLSAVPPGDWEEAQAPANEKRGWWPFGKK